MDTLTLRFLQFILDDHSIRQASYRGGAFFDREAYHALETYRPRLVAAPRSRGGELSSSDIGAIGVTGWGEGHGQRSRKKKAGKEKNGGSG